jgi:hypothetical protein
MHPTARANAHFAAHHRSVGTHRVRADHPEHRSGGAQPGGAFESPGLVPVLGVAVGGDQAVQREVAERLPDRLVRGGRRAQQAPELLGGGDLEDAERAEDVGAQRGGRAVRVGGAAPVRAATGPGRDGCGGSTTSAWPSWSSGWAAR